MFLSTTSLADHGSLRARVALVILAAALSFGSAGVAAASCTTSSDCLWPVGCAFLGEPLSPIPLPGGPVAIRSVVLTDRPPCTPVPVGSFIVDSFFDVFFDLSIDGGATWAPKASLGHQRSQLTLTSPPAANPRTFDTEMLQLDISGGTLPGGMLLRESPTRPSTGHTDDTSLGGGLYKIDSFFDVFFELSTDNGVTWLPAFQSMHLTLGTGNPTPTLNTTWGAVKSFYR